MRNFQLHYTACAIRTARRGPGLVLIFWFCAQMISLTAAFCFAGRDTSHAVRLCKSPQCPRMVWNRDVNASINMLHLLLAFAQGEDKPAHFRRGVAV